MYKENDIQNLIIHLVYSSIKNIYNNNNNNNKLKN